MTTKNIALILWNTDVIDLMSLVLLQWKLTSRGVEPSQGEKAIEQLIASYNPSVVVFDLDPPYAVSGAVVDNLIRRFPDQSFVLTCADPILALIKTPALFGYPIFQKPYEPDELAKTVAGMAARSADREASKKPCTTPLGVPSRSDPCGLTAGIERTFYSVLPSTAAKATAPEAAASKAAACAETAGITG